MRFEDREVQSLDLIKVDGASRLIIEYLCGEKHYPRLTEDENKLLAASMTNAAKKGLNYEQFNELLLLLNQDRVGEDFFKFFFEKDNISLDELKLGVIKFRSFAMLCFGNFRFAYKQLIQKSETELKEKIIPYWEKPSNLLSKFDRRPSKMLDIERIERDETWYLGEISGARIKKEVEVLDKDIEKCKNKSEKDQKKQFGKKLLEMDRQVKEAREKALKNTEIYLTWDYMDIYIATSMRNKWEFEEIFDFIDAVFKDKKLTKLDLRYFDPTQSKCKNPRDKGLIEGLMLKRALCTIYLAQESDTMGKDSELAATLAQSKPVIAYVPKHEPIEYSDKIKDYPLDFFKKRLLVLDAEEIFDDPACAGKIRAEVKDFQDKIDNFLDVLNDYRKDQPFSLWVEKEDEFKQTFKNFSDVCQILAIAECYNFDRRAELLKARHPLSMQVDLESGVANGVLVVRAYEECAELLYRILTNSLEFSIVHQDEGYTVLVENISGSQFRVVTDYERLTNSFWNLFA